MLDVDASTLQAFQKQVKLGNRLIYEELNYDTTELKEKFNLLSNLLHYKLGIVSSSCSVNIVFYIFISYIAEEQSKIFNTIIQVANRQHCPIIFLYGYGGTSKTHMWKTLKYALRSQKQIWYNFFIITRGRTTHSKFKIHISTLENSICNVHRGSKLVDLLKQIKLIIWDEAPMTHKFCFEALDRSLADIMGTTSNDSILFGGKLGCHSDIIHATINSSYLWHQCRILTLLKNMHLQNNDNASEIKEFPYWILKVGDGKLYEPNDECVEVDIP
ncbi:hypothetical protein Lal_00032100 [Lupinus albus]|nr:hypothetical protein Lal_00032100 [Lupinus albus]